MTGVLTAAVLAAVGVMAPSSTAAPPAKPLKLLIEAAPAFHRLPLTALGAIAGKYNLEIEMLQVRGGGEAGQIFAGGHGDIMTAGFDKPVGFVAKKLVDVKTFGVVLHSMN